MTKLREWVDNRPFASREIENNINAKSWRDNKEYYGIFEKGPIALRITTSLPLYKFKSTGKETYKISKLLGRQ